jgi:hypothetical protein
MNVITQFDSLTGAKQWALSSRHVAVVAAIILGLIRAVCKQKYNVNWYSLVHAAATGILSAVCVYINIFGAVKLTQTTEPMGSILCYGPLTTIHAIVPAITMGFGVFDIIEGFSHGIDFVSNVHNSQLLEMMI